MRFKLLATAFAVTGAGLLLASCETPSMSEDQCLTVDWNQKGYSDGAAGYGHSRLDDHIKACAEFGVVADSTTYYAAMDQGRRVYCTQANGFRAGAGGNGSSNGFCPADLEQDYLFGYADGQVVWAAYQRVSDAQNRVNEAYSRANQLKNDIEFEEGQLEDETLTDEQRDATRQRLRRLRNDRERELESIRELEWIVDDAEAAYADVRSRYIPAYGNF